MRNMGKVGQEAIETYLPFSEGLFLAGLGFRAS